MSNSQRRLAAILAIHIAAAMLFLSPGYLEPDSVAIYAYLRSVAFDGDLLFFNEWAGFGLVEGGVTLFKEVTPSGALANHWWIGTSLLSAPFYAGGHLVQALAGRALDGFTGAYAFSLAWSVVFFGALTSWIAWCFLRDELQYSVRRSVATVTFLWFGTPLFFYEFRFPLGSHIAGAFCVAALLWFLRRLEIDSSSTVIWLAGLALGLAVATRLQHFVLAPAALLALWRGGRSWRDVLIFGFAAALPVATQLIAWHTIYGHPLGPLVTGSIEGATWMPFRNNALLTVLFTSYHGLFSWSPVLLFALSGWLLLYVQKEHRRLAQICLLMFVGEWVANGLFDRYFWGGMSFGARRFIDLAVPFAVGIGATLNRKTFIPAAAAVLWSVCLSAAAMTGRLELSADVSFTHMVGSAFSVSVSQLTETIARTAAAIRVPALTIATLIACVAALAALSAVCALPRRLSFLLTTYLSLIIVALMVVHARSRSRVESELRRFGIDLEISRSLGPLLDARGLIRDEATYFMRRHDPRAEDSLRDVRVIEAHIERLRQLRTSGP